MIIVIVAVAEGGIKVANYVAEIAKLYGLKLNEVFRLSGCVGTYFKFVDEGLVRSNCDDIWRTEPQDLVDILTGNYRVVRIASKPLYGSTYYVASPANINMYETFSWRDTIEDKEFYKRGLVFSTAFEAIEASKDVFDMLSNTAFIRLCDGNHIAEVSQMLGVKIGEAFKIGDDAFGEWPKYYRFSENVCLEVSDDGVEWKEMDDGSILECLLLDEVRIIKLLWKPEYNEKYYIPSINNADGYNDFYWKGDDSDDEYYNLGLVFKSKEEAIALRQKMLAVAKEGVCR